MDFNGTSLWKGRAWSGHWSRVYACGSGCKDLPCSHSHVGGIHSDVTAHQLGEERKSELRNEGGSSTPLKCYWWQWICRGGSQTLSKFCDCSGDSCSFYWLIAWVEYFQQMKKGRSLPIGTYKNLMFPSSRNMQFPDRKKEPCVWVTCQMTATLCFFLFSILLFF